MPTPAEMDTGCLHQPGDPSGADDAASSSAASASSARGCASRTTRLRRGVRLRLRRRRQEPTLSAGSGSGGEGGGSAGVQDDLALPLGMSFAAVLAQVRANSTGREGSTDVPVLIFTPFLSVLLICDPVTDEA